MWNFLVEYAFELVVTLIALLFLALAHWAGAQGMPMQTPQEQLALCQNLVRVKADLQGSAEQLAAALLKRAEKAEAEVAQLKAAPQKPLEILDVPAK